MTERDIGRDPSEGTIERALALAYRYVGRRERTKQELREHLQARDFAPEIVAEAVAELAEFGYVDDARYAQLFAQDKRGLEGWGSERIARALRERGLARELIAQAVDGQDREEELAQALEVLRRRCPDPPRERRERDRALGILLRKGYESELALEALQLHASGPGARFPG
jgi:regulatory protein